ncbi:23S rRNA (guanosine(2251)-2'-O)-methyltransferase RlmB [Pseudomonadota bacterium]
MLKKSKYLQHYNFKSAKQGKQNLCKNCSSSDNNEIRSYIYGKHPVLMAILHKKRELKKLFVTDRTIKIFEKFIQQNSIILPKNLKIEKVNNKYITSLTSKNAVHQGFLLECSSTPKLSLNTFLNSIQTDMKKLPNILILDEITDPHNIGAIIRSASAFEFENIIITEKNSPKDSSIISKSSAGMVETVNLIQVTNLNSTIKELKEIGYWIIGLDSSAKQNINETEFKNIALITGSEGKGIKELVKKNCDILVKIPMSNKVESLNASVATGIALYELNKIKKWK